MILLQAALSASIITTVYRDIYVQGPNKVLGAITHLATLIFGALSSFAMTDLFSEKLIAVTLEHKARASSLRILIRSFGTILGLTIQTVMLLTMNP